MLYDQRGCFDGKNSRHIINIYKLRSYKKYRLHTLLILRVIAWEGQMHMERMWQEGRFVRDMLDLPMCF